MKKVIWKYQLNIGETALSIPKNGAIIYLNNQNEIPCLWILVDPEEELVTRTFKIVATGEDIDYNNTDFPFYLGSFQIVSVNFVGHVFEKRT